jgi:hypothetical protein
MCAGAKGRSMSLVVKSWRADSSKQDEDGNFVAIECRQEGIIGFVMNALGIAPTTNIKVGSERVEFTAASLAGYSRKLIPLQGICTTYYGFRRPIREAILIAMVGVFLGGSIISSASGAAGFIILLVGIGLAILYYVLNKKLTLDFVENSGVVSGIQVKRSVIEGKKIEEEDAHRVCQIIQNVIEARTI